MCSALRMMEARKRGRDIVFVEDMLVQVFFESVIASDSDDAGTGSKRLGGRYVGP